jgi:hypothetical protein
MEKLLWEIWTSKIKARIIISQCQASKVGKAKVQTIENKKPSDTLGNRLSTTRAEIVCALEFYLVKRLDDKSRMKREFHVRFCESLRGKYFGLLDF